MVDRSPRKQRTQGFSAVCAISLCTTTALLLAGCDRPQAKHSAKASEKQDKVVATLNDTTEQAEAPDTPTLPTPGNGLHQRRVTGISAAHVGLNLVLEASISREGQLERGRLDSTMNTDLLEQAIGAYATGEMPAEREEQIAFLCNAYNANALSTLAMLSFEFGDDLSSDEWIDDSLRERFDDQPIRLANETLSLRTLREERILAMGDPRTLGCLLSVDRIKTGLPREAIWPNNIDRQLDRLCSAWVKSTTLADVVDGKVVVSPAIEQSAAAFEGQPFNGVLGFVRYYADPEVAASKNLHIEPANETAQ